MSDLFSFSTLSFLILVFRLPLSLSLSLSDLLSSLTLSLCWWLGLHAGKKQRPWVAIQAVGRDSGCESDLVAIAA